MGATEPELIDLRVIPDERGPIVVGQFGDDLPFIVRRFFFLSSDVREVKRGGHAHKTLEQMVICIGGMAIANTIAGTNGRAILRDKGQGLYLPPMTWLDLTLFARSTVLVLASAEYDESDYIRDKNAFLATV